MYIKFIVYNTSMFQKCLALIQWIVPSVLMTFAISSLGECRQMSVQNLLLKELLDSYGFQSTRPVYNVSDVTTVEFSLRVVQVIELNERHQTIEVGVWIQQRWTDKYLTWDPKEHNGVDELWVDKSNIWLPDIALYKSVDRHFESHKDTPVIVHNNGHVLWSSPAILKTSCRINARLFPFDTQSCELRFTSWTYDVTQLNLTHSEYLLEEVGYSDVGVWELLQGEIHRESKTYGSKYYSELSYLIHLRRRSLSFVLEIILPCVLLSALNLMVFILPAESGEKISLGTTNLLSLLLFQQLVGAILPPTSENAPIIGFHFTIMITLSCFSIIFTVVVLNIYFRDNRHPIPRSIKYFTFEVLGKLVRYQTPEETEQNVTSEQADNDCHQNKGIDIGLKAGHSQDFMLSDVHCCRMDDWAENCSMNSENCQISSMRDYVPAISSPLARAKRHDQFDEERPGRKGHQPSDIKTCKNPVWRDVALVMDRTALLISTVVTLVSIGVTVIGLVMRKGTI